MIEAADGALWGTTEKGGIWDSGTVFRVNPRAVYGGENDKNTPQVTGRVIRVNTGEIVVQKGKNTVQFERSSDVQTSPEPKVGDKVTVNYRSGNAKNGAVTYRATKIEIKN